MTLQLVETTQSLAMRARMVATFAKRLNETERFSYLRNVRRLDPEAFAALRRQPMTHFVGFTDERYWAAVRVFGRPDFFHRVWDERARQEIAPGDMAVFAKYDPKMSPSEFSWNDSERF